MVEMYSKTPQEVTVWVGIVGNIIVRPFLIDGNLIVNTRRNVSIL